MIALPSIAFGAFSGSAKDVTARQVGCRSILSVRCWPTGQATNKQTECRSKFAAVTRSYRLLTDTEMAGWSVIAEHATGQSVLGQKARLSGFNMYVRLNVRQTNAGYAMFCSAPMEIPETPIVIINP